MMVFLDIIFRILNNKKKKFSRMTLDFWQENNNLPIFNDHWMMMMMGTNENRKKTIWNFLLLATICYYYYYYYEWYLSEILLFKTIHTSTTTTTKWSVIIWSIFFWKGGEGRGFIFKFNEWMNDSSHFHISFHHLECRF